MHVFCVNSCVFFWFHGLLSLLLVHNCYRNGPQLTTICCESYPYSSLPFNLDPHSVWWSPMETAYDLWIIGIQYCLPQTSVFWILFIRGNLQWFQFNVCVSTFLSFFPSLISLFICFVLFIQFIYFFHYLSIYCFPSFHSYPAFFCCVSLWSCFHASKHVDADEQSRPFSFVCTTPQQRKHRYDALRHASYMS